MTLSDFKWQQNFKRHGVLGENIFVATMQVSFSVQESPRERCKSYSHWVTVTNRKPNTVYRMVPFSITSNDSKPNFQSWLLHYNRPANISELSSGSYPSFTVSLPFPSPRPIPPFPFPFFSYPFPWLSLSHRLPHPTNPAIGGLGSAVSFLSGFGSRAHRRQTHFGATDAKLGWGPCKFT